MVGGGRKEGAERRGQKGGCRKEGARSSEGRRVRAEGGKE